jgi:RNA polymerase sigma-70 factor (ECF subfamily)
MEISTALSTPLDAERLLGDERLAIDARTDPAAFALLYERHVGHVFRFLRARGAVEDVAADLTATTFERALAHIDRYRPGPAGFAPWLLRIARNAYTDVARRSRVTAQLDEAAHVAEASPSPEAAAIAAEEQRGLLRLIRSLPEVHQEALVLRYVVGLSSREIGVVIGKSEAATKKLITRALASLKEASSND